MTNQEMAEAHLHQAQEILLEAQALMARGVWNLVVRRAQEAVELALKAALRRVGVEVPRVRDVGVTMKDHAGRFPAASVEQLDLVASISRRLSLERELSFYGDEMTGTAPHRLYSLEDARQALEEARLVLRWCSEVVTGRP